jgi:hypothetical protein
MSTYNFKIASLIKELNVSGNLHQTTDNKAKAINKPVLLVEEELFRVLRKHFESIRTLKFVQHSSFIALFCRYDFKIYLKS